MTGWKPVLLFGAGQLCALHFEPRKHTPRVAVALITLVLLSYLLGSIPTGFLVAKAMGVDIRSVGSGNIGATNVFRILGKGPGIFVLTADAVKAEILKAGFTLDGESNVLANASDDHSKPAMVMKDGADRFLLRFKKPANAPRDQRASAEAHMKVLYGNTLVTGLGIDRQRDLFFHPDGTYEEFGRNGSNTQEGYWYNDPSGKRLCILHQFPQPERGYTFCLNIPDHKVGEQWPMHGRRGDETDAILAGYVYP